MNVSDTDLVHCIIHALPCSQGGMGWNWRVNIKALTQFLAREQKMNLSICKGVWDAVSTRLALIEMV